jgi:predicted phage tail component-like protein
MSFNERDLRLFTTINGRQVPTVQPMCDSRPFPEFRDSTSRVEGADGETLDSLVLGPREFTVTLVAINNGQGLPGIQDTARRLGDLLLVRQPKRFVFQDEQDKFGTQLVRYAIPTGAFDSEEFIQAGKWTVHFKQPDPYLYGKAGSKHLEPGVSTEVAVGGNAPAKLIAKATPETGKSYYTLQSSGHGTIKFRADFDGETVITVNFANQAISLSKTVTGSGLTAGSRFFSFDGTPLMRAYAPTDLSWQERWI